MVTDARFTQIRKGRFLAAAFAAIALCAHVSAALAGGTVSVTAPGEGAVYWAGENVVIRWAHSGDRPHHFKIGLSTNGGASYDRTLTVLNNGDARSWTWRNPDVRGSNLRVRVWAFYLPEPTPHYAIGRSPLFCILNPYHFTN